jgi:hypothetical protein
MSNDGRSIGEHLRDTEAGVLPDSSATRQPVGGPERESDITNRTFRTGKRQQRKPRGDRKGCACVITPD